MKKLNNRGFTLVELLAVLVILIAIMSIAIPSISSSLERSKAKQNEARKKVIIAAAELYVTDNKNKIYKTFQENTAWEKCQISFKELVHSGYLSNEELKDADDNDISGVIEYTKDGGGIEIVDKESGNNCV
jgi:type IV pilus assembly protein PilA